MCLFFQKKYLQDQSKYLNKILINVLIAVQTGEAVSSHKHRAQCSTVVQMMQMFNVKMNGTLSLMEWMVIMRTTTNE